MLNKVRGFELLNDVFRFVITIWYSCKLLLVWTCIGSSIRLSDRHSFIDSEFSYHTQQHEIHEPYRNFSLAPCSENKLCSAANIWIRVVICYLFVSHHTSCAVDCCCRNTGDG